MKLSVGVVRILAPQGEQIVEWYASFFHGIPTEVLLDERWSETVKPGGHCRMGGEKIARPRGGQRHFKRLRLSPHETAGALQHSKGGMTFIQVTDIRPDAEGGSNRQPPIPSSISCFRRNSGPPPYNFAGDSTMRGEVRRIIAVQQVKFHPAYLDLPGAQPD